MQWLKIKSTNLQFWKPEVIKSRCCQGCILPEALGRMSFPPFPVSSGCLHPFPVACASIIKASCVASSNLSPLLLWSHLCSLWPSRLPLRKTPWFLWAHLDNPGQSHLKSLDLSTLVEFLLPCNTHNFRGLDHEHRWGPISWPWL